MASTVYMLNPGADLPSTQAAFETMFLAHKTWLVRQLPPSVALSLSRTWVALRAITHSLAKGPFCKHPLHSAP